MIQHSPLNNSYDTLNNQETMKAGGKRGEGRLCTSSLLLLLILLALLLFALLTLLTLLTLLLVRLFLDDDIVVRVRGSGLRLDVAANHALVVGVARLALRTDHLQVVAQQTMTTNRSPVGRSSQRADDARADEDRQVEPVLRVPFRSCRGKRDL